MKISALAGGLAALAAVSGCGGPRTPAPPELAEYREAVKLYRTSQRGSVEERKASEAVLEEGGKKLRDYAQGLCAGKKEKEMSDFEKDLAEFDEELGPREMTSFNGSAYVETTGRPKILVKLAKDESVQCRQRIHNGW